MYSPIVLTCFNRPYHTLKTLEALSKNPEALHSELFIFIDGPRNDKEKHLVDAVEQIVISFKDYFKSQNIERSPKNLSCDVGLRLAVTKILSKYEDIIILEDDDMPSEFFLAYMNNALKKYKLVKNIWHINGFNYPINSKSKTDCFFTRLMCTWGWATWRDRWNKFINDPLSQDYLYIKSRFDKKMIKAIDFGIKNGFFWYLIDANISGQINNSYEICWYTYIFLNKGLCLTPKVSLINNIGLDGSGLHCGAVADDNKFNGEFIYSKKVNTFPEEPIEDKYSFELLAKYFKKRKNLFFRIKFKINSLMVNILKRL